MNFVARAFKSLTDSSPFTVIDKVEVSDNNPWELYTATLKSNGRPVSVFHYKVTDPTHPYPHPAPGTHLAALRAKLPLAVEFIDVYPPLEGSTAGTRHYVITERVYPIDFRHSSTEFGKFAIKSVLDTLETAAKEFRVHVLSISPETVMQTESGVVKLVGIDFIYDEKNEDTKQVAEQMKYFYPDQIPKDSRVATYDTYALGTLVRTVLPEASNLSAKMVSMQRPRITNLLNLDEFVTDNCLTTLQRTFQYYQNDDPSFVAKISETIKLCNAKSCLSKRITANYVLPQLFALNNLRFLGLCLELVATLGKLEPYPLIIDWICAQWASLDRAVRIWMLSTAPSYIEEIPLTVFQQKIAPKYLAGFTDTNVQVKSLTIDAVPLLQLKLSSKQLNSELLRMLAKTLVDSNDDIRKRTVIALYRLGPHLDNQQVVYTAFSRALKDRIVANKLLALLAICAMDIPVNDIIERLIGPVIACVLDKDAEVAKTALILSDKLMKQVKEAAIVASPRTLISQSQAESRLLNEYTEPEKFASNVLSSQSKPQTVHNTLQVEQPVSNLSSSPVEKLSDSFDAWGWDDEDGVVDDKEVEDAWGF